MSFAEIYNTLQEINAISITVRLILATILGGIIGLERGIKKRPAGMRTYMLVCIGATLVMITNQYLTNIFPYADPARLGAQVISGIGFLGVGTIIITRDRQVRGLTTAAGLWASACMGLAIGIGFYSGALIAMVFIFFVTTVMHRLDTEIIRRSRTMEMYMELTDSSYVYKVLDHLRENDIKVTNMEVMRPKYEKESENTKIALLLLLYLPKRKLHYEVISKLGGFEYVSFIESVD
ncbi:MAG: MgtC/SapB family protein [Oscillospiraceae bacterium]|nr:MgtC/SapB family protein [Oscillospiraceae bacterium]